MTLDKKVVHMVSTGGTIEKVYDEKSGILGNRRSIIEDIIKSKLRLPFTDLKFHDLMAKDSLDLTDHDREFIFSFVSHLASNGNPVIILHGTDTLQKTFHFFEERMTSPRVPLVFTGAMRPIGFSDSDALQNLTESLLVARVLDPGLYLVFHNQVIQGSGFTKKHELGTFVELSKEIL